MCGKKGHIRPDCPLKEDEQADEQVEVDETPKPTSNLKKKAVQFVATTDDDEVSSSSEVCATQFGFLYSWHLPQRSSTSDPPRQSVNLRHILQQGSCHQIMEVKIIHHRARQRQKHYHKLQGVCKELWRSVVRHARHHKSPVPEERQK